MALPSRNNRIINPTPAGSHPGMEKLPSLADSSSFWRSFHPQPFVVRSAQRGEPFEIDALFSKGVLKMPMSTPVYTGDIVEQEDPRGGVLEYVVTAVDFRKDPFKRGMDHADVKVREKGHAAHKYGTINVHISGGANQLSIGDGNTLTHTVQNAEAESLITALREILAKAPRPDLSEAELEEVTEAVDEAESVLRDPGAKPNAVKRALLAVKGVVEDLGTKAADEGVKAWARGAVALVLAQLPGGAQ